MKRFVEIEIGNSLKLLFLEYKEHIAFLTNKEHGINTSALFVYLGVYGVADTFAQIK
jgi:hypothetical protein